MWVLQTVLELILAAFSVLGLYGTVCAILRRTACDDRISLAVKILTQRDAESAEVLIRDALFHYPLGISGRPLVLVTEELRNHPVLREALQTYGLDCFVVCGVSAEGDE